MLFHPGMNKSLSSFQYTDHEVYDLVRESMYDVEFAGIRTHYVFDRFGNPSGLVMLQQQQGEHTYTQRKLVYEGFFFKPCGLLIKSNGFIKVCWVNDGL